LVVGLWKVISLVIGKIDKIMSNKYEAKKMLMNFGFCHETISTLLFKDSVSPIRFNTVDDIFQYCIKKGEFANVGNFEYSSPRQDYPTLIKKSDRAFVYYHNSGTAFTEAIISLDDNKFPTYSDSLVNINRMKSIYNSLSENDKRRAILGIRAGVLPTRQDFGYSKILNSLCLTLDGKILY
jgi:hypothetical protein